METDESPLKRVLDAAPTGDEHISTKWVRLNIRYIFTLPQYHLLPMETPD